MEIKTQNCSAIELIAAMENSVPLVNDFEYEKLKHENSALLPFIKHHHFKEECEWRIVRMCYSRHPDDERIVGGKLHVPVPLESSLGNIQRLLSEIIVSPHGDSDFLHEYAKSVMRVNQMEFLTVRDSNIRFR